MVKLKNIEVVGKFAKCDYYPERLDEHGTIEVNLATKEIIRDSNPKGCAAMYPFYAKLRLIDICTQGKPIPKETCCMWY